MSWYLIQGKDGALGCNPTFPDGSLCECLDPVGPDDILTLGVIDQGELTDGKPIADVIEVGLDLAVSRRVHNLFRMSRLDRNIQCCDAIVRHCDGTIHRHYCFYRTLVLYNVVNRDKSSVRYLKGTDVIYSIDRWVLRGSGMPDVDLFRCEEWRWICSQRLMELVTGIGATGIEFLPVEVV